MPKLCREFPVQLALGALLIYGMTLSHGVTANSLAVTAKIAGWDWQPMLGQPLLWLFTLPARWLPGAWLPVGLNFFSGLCGAVTLGILARSLARSPWVAPVATLPGWRGRLPLLLAVAACGLEFNFWQDAAVATGEMLALLFLAAAIGCGLEYLVTKRLRWLRWAAFFWGLGLAENWAMQITLPLFALALARMLKKKVLQPKILLTLAGLGLAGFSTYALLPLANGLLPGSPWSFATSWSHSLRDSKDLLMGIYAQFWLMNRMTALTVGLFFILPGLAVLLCFKPENTKNESSLNRLLIWLFRGVRVGLLVFCLWLAFDPIFGPRQLLRRETNLSLPLLTFDYLNALGIGFLASNLLLTFQPRVKLRRRRRFRENLVVQLERAAAPALTGLFMVVSLGLVARNLSAIRLSNRQPLTQIGDQLLRLLPSDGGIVVSDFPDKLAVLQAALARHPEKSGWLPLDIAALAKPEYRAHWQRLHVGLPLSETEPGELRPAEMFSLVNRLAQTNRIFYVHPSFGYFFEVFHQQSTGLAWEMKRLPTNSFTPPSLPPELIAQNEQHWEELTPNLQSLQKANEPAKPSSANALARHLFLAPVVPSQIPLLCEWYSLALDDWGVQLQRNGRLTAAQKRFTQSLTLNPNNLAARLNLSCNASLQSGAAISLEGASQLAEKIYSLKNLRLALSIWGPMDEPNACYLLGFTFQRAGMPVQAIQQFERAHALAPAVLAPEFALAEIFGRCHQQERAADTVEHLRAEIKSLPDQTNALAKLVMLEDRIHSAQTNSAQPDLPMSPMGQKISLPNER